jgi:hypothetical protein
MTESELQVNLIISSFITFTTVNESAVYNLPVAFSLFVQNLNCQKKIDENKIKERLTTVDNALPKYLMVDQHEAN